MPNTEENRIALAETVEDGVRYILVVPRLDPTVFDGGADRVGLDPTVVAVLADPE